ncbi:HAD family hydrolase [Acuticoccus mangrovi]|uniref:HAD family hydrolase n=1 Tax=Acuticoccus mangrovi TaxID=2796142 RepID=A0A934MF15_9HYPH|nr:HAD family hydrolase [Acuticoccus mangrovi]
MIPDLVIFDCDGVLVDSETISCRIDAAALTAEGYPIDAEEMARRFAGVPSADVYRRVGEERGAPLPADFEDRVDRQILAAYPAQLKAIGPVGEVARGLGLPMCVASSSRPAKLLLALIVTDLVEIFYPHIFSASLVAHGKPAPDIFLYAAAAMGVTPERTVVVEDSVAGVTAGVAAGMTVIGFAGASHCGPHHADRLTAAGARITIASHADLAGAIDRLP